MPQNTSLYKAYKNKYVTTSEIVCPKSHLWSPLLSNGTAPHREILMCVAYASDGQYFATGSGDGTIDLWNPLSGAHIRSFGTKFPQAISKICFLSNCQYLICTSSNYKEVYLWDIITGTHILTFQGHSDTINDISVSTTQLATASNDKTAKIWDINTAQCQSILQHFDKATSVFLDPKEEARVLSATQNQVLIWNSITREAINMISKPGLEKLIVSPCGDFIACAFRNTLKIYDSSDLKTCIKSVSSNESRNAVFSRCSNYIAFSQQNTIVVSEFQVSNQSDIKLQANSYQVAFSSDSKQLTSGKLLNLKSISHF